MKRVLTNVIIWVSEGTLNTYYIPTAEGKRQKEQNMRNRDFTSLCEYVKNADKNDPIWYAGYLWIDLTEKQIDKIVGIIKLGKKTIFSHTIGNAVFEREIIETPSGMKLYSNHKKVFDDVKELVDCCSEQGARAVILGLYNTNFITCGEYRVLFDWIEEHTDGNGRVSKNW